MLSFGCHMVHQRSQPGRERTPLAAAEKEESLLRQKAALNVRSGLHKLWLSADKQEAAAQTVLHTTCTGNLHASVMDVVEHVTN
jgi:hypothetical protein